MPREKLIRHRVPALAAATTGDVLRTRRAEPGERLPFLRDKLLEEVAEFLGSGSVEELADVQEVVLALQVEMGAETCAAVAAKKYSERGGFYQGVVLILED